MCSLPAATKSSTARFRPEPTLAWISVLIAAALGMGSLYRDGPELDEAA